MHLEELDAGKLAKAINTIKDGVDKSCFGPMFQYPDMKDISKRQVNQLALGVFTIVLTQIFRGAGDKE